jgi:hypothetical protein
VKESSGGPVFDGKLGLRGVTLANRARQEHFQPGVLDIEKVGHELWVMRRPSSGGREVVLSAWRKDHFERLARFSASKKEQTFPLGEHSSIFGLMEP